MKHGSLFSGIGGFDLAAEWIGWENVFHCEWKEFNQKILKYYWPNAISYSDITKTDFTPHRGAIDILTGGFPCQPYSVAGKRKGKEDDRHLWPEMLRAVREIQPRFILGENVGGLVSWSGGLVFEEVQTDLETEGYEVQAFILPACAVGAPHRRDRLWLVAHSKCERLQGFITKRKDLRLHQRQALTEHSDRDVFNWFSGFRTDDKYIRKGNGFPRKLYAQSLQSLGNAIVPQVAYEIFKAIQESANTLNKQ